MATHMHTSACRRVLPAVLLPQDLASSTQAVAAGRHRNSDGLWLEASYAALALALIV